MHRGDGGTHNDGAGNLARRCPFGLLSKIKYEYQGGKRKCDRKRNGQGHKEGMKPEYRSQTHGRHADVMHGCNTAAHITLRANARTMPSSCRLTTYSAKAEAEIATKSDSRT